MTTTFDPTADGAAEQMRDWRINDLLRGAQAAHVFAHGVRKADDAVRIVALCDEAGQPGSIRDAAGAFCETPTVESADFFRRVAVDEVARLLQ